MHGKTARIWRAIGDERDNSTQNSRFCERKVARKPGMLRIYLHACAAHHSFSLTYRTLWYT